MTKILFVCHGNICRSPMAEYMMKKMVKEAGVEREYEIASAAATSEDIGNDIYPAARRKLAAEGVPFEHRAARLLTRKDFREYDYVIGMDEENLYDMRRIAGPEGRDRISLMLDYTSRPGDVADPWYTGNFDEAYKDIAEGCEGLLRKLELKRYISKNYLPGETLKEPAGGYATSALPVFEAADGSFSDTLMNLVAEKCGSYSEFYSRANMSRQVFSRINSDRGYRPTRQTAFACAIGLQLNLAETKELLARAGYAFSRSILTDVIVEYFIKHRQYDITAINEVLFDYNQQLLGQNLR